MTLTPAIEGETLIPTNMNSKERITAKPVILASDKVVGTPMKYVKGSLLLDHQGIDSV